MLLNELIINNIHELYENAYKLGIFLNIRYKKVTMQRFYEMEKNWN